MVRKVEADDVKKRSKVLFIKRIFYWYRLFLSVFKVSPYNEIKVKRFSFQRLNNSSQKVSILSQKISLEQKPK